MVEIDVFAPEIGSHPHKILLIAHNVDSFELFEERSNGREPLPHFRPRFDGNAKRRRVIEVETQKRVRHRPGQKVGHEEIDRSEVRDRHLAFPVADREILPTAVVEITDPR